MSIKIFQKFENNDVQQQPPLKQDEPVSKVKISP